jgi:hypothetical protein
MSPVLQSMLILALFREIIGPEWSRLHFCDSNLVILNEGT